MIHTSRTLLLLFVFGFVFIFVFCLSHFALALLCFSHFACFSLNCFPFYISSQSSLIENPSSLFHYLQPHPVRKMCTVLSMGPARQSQSTLLPQHYVRYAICRECSQCLCAGFTRAAEVAPFPSVGFSSKPFTVFLPLHPQAC